MSLRWSFWLSLDFIFYKYFALLELLDFFKFIIYFLWHIAPLKFFIIFQFDFYKNFTLPELPNSFKLLSLKKLWKSEIFIAQKIHIIKSPSGATYKFNLICHYFSFTTHQILHQKQNIYAFYR